VERMRARKVWNCCGDFMTVASTGRYLLFEGA
jgi:hypothetical protein